MEKIFTRNRPHLRLDLKEFRKEEKEHNYFHLDHCERQVYIILLNDLDENSTSYTIHT